MNEKGSMMERTVAILTLLAQGYTTEQILDQYKGLTSDDISDAAQEALERIREQAALEDSWLERFLETMRHRQPHWDEACDDQLAVLYQAGANLQQMVSRLHRRPATVRQRLCELGLITADEMLF